MGKKPEHDLSRNVVANTPAGTLAARGGDEAPPGMVLKQIEEFGVQPPEAFPVKRYPAARGGVLYCLR